MVGRASQIQHDVQEMVRKQVAVFIVESSLTSSELFEYHVRAQKIKALYLELDKIGRERIAGASPEHS